MLFLLDLLADGAREDGPASPQHDSEVMDLAPRLFLELLPNEQSSQSRRRGGRRRGHDQRPSWAPDVFQWVWRASS